MKKGNWIIALTLAAALSLAGCGAAPEEPAATATPEPTVTAVPTAEPTEEPTAEPTEEPTAEPTSEPTEEPTAEPAAAPDTAADLAEKGRTLYAAQLNRYAAALSEQWTEGRYFENGMSELARDGENINGGLLVSVTPEDFGGTDVLAGVAFQRRLEEAAYALGGGGYAAPAQTVGDFLAHRPSIGPGRVTPTYRPAVRWCDLHECLPPFVCAALEEALPLLEKKLHGFAAPDAVLTAVETRSSSPVRIVRDNTYQTALRGLYPCGEGAGYAGGILSAAADGMRCAEQIIKEITQHG